MRRLLKWYAPKAFDSGLLECNNLAKRLLLKNPVENFLDIGCGDGALTLEFAKILKPKNIYGIEFVDDIKKKAEEKGITCVKEDLNGRWSLKSESFDFILSSQSIEHMHNTRFYLEECFRCLKCGGQVIILTENLASWINIGSLLFGWQPFSTTSVNGWAIGNPFIWYSGETREKENEFINKNLDSGVSGTIGHVRVLAYRGLRDALLKAGFKDVKVYGAGYLPFWGPISRILCKIDKRHGHFLAASAVK